MYPILHQAIQDNINKFLAMPPARKIDAAYEVINGDSYQNVLRIKFTNDKDASDFIDFIFTLQIESKKFPGKKKSVQNSCVYLEPAELDKIIRQMNNASFHIDFNPGFKYDSSAPVKIKPLPNDTLTQAEKNLLKLFEDENAILKVIESNILEQNGMITKGKDLTFNLNQWADPDKVRPSFAKYRKKLDDGAKVIKINLHSGKVRTHIVGSGRTKRKKKNHGIDKPYGHAKATPMTLSTTKSEYMKLFTNNDGDTIYIWEIGLNGEEPKKCYLKKGKNGVAKDVYAENAVTNEAFRLSTTSVRQVDIERLKISKKFTTIEAIRETNRRAVENKTVISHNEIKACPPARFVNGIGMQKDSLVDRMRKLAEIYIVKSALGLAEIPILIRLPNQPHRIYKHTERLEDVIIALSQPSSSPEYRLLAANKFQLLKDVLNESIQYLLPGDPFLDVIIENCKKLGVPTELFPSEIKNLSKDKLKKMFNDYYVNNNLAALQQFLIKQQNSNHSNNPDLLQIFDECLIEFIDNNACSNPISNRFILQYIQEKFKKLKNEERFPVLEYLYSNDLYPKLTGEGKLSILNICIVENDVDALQFILSLALTDSNIKSKEISLFIEEMFAVKQQEVINIILTKLSNDQLNKLFVDLSFKDPVCKIRQQILDINNFELNSDTIQSILTKNSDYFMKALLSQPKVEKALLSNEEAIKNFLIKNGKSNLLKVLKHLLHVKIGPEADPKDSLFHLAVRDGDKKLIFDLINIIRTEETFGLKNSKGDSFIDLACRLSQFEFVELIIATDIAKFIPVKRACMVLFMQYIEEKHAGMHLFQAFSTKNRNLFNLILKEDSSSDNIFLRQQNNCTIIEVLLKNNAFDYLNDIMQIENIRNKISKKDFAQILVKSLQNNNEDILKSIFATNISFDEILRTIDSVALDAKQKRALTLQYIYTKMKNTNNAKYIHNFVKKVETHAPHLFKKNLFKFVNEKNKMISKSGANIYTAAKNRIFAIHQADKLRSMNDNEIQAFLERKHNSEIVNPKSYSTLFHNVFHARSKKTEKQLLKKFNEESVRIDQWMQKKMIVKK